MSRSALTRQEGNIRERERRAEEIYEEACAEGQRRNTERWGNPANDFHLNHLLLQNIKTSQYFQKICQELHDWNAVIDEIYYRVEHVGVFEVGKVPSTAFCLLLRLLTLNMTPHQLQNTITHGDSPYIRAIGFLYLRFAGIPTEIGSIIQPHLLDLENEIAIGPSGNRQKKMSMGEYLCRMFGGGTTDYFGETSLPRFPIHAERTIAVLVLAAEKILERAQKHVRNNHHRNHTFRIQARVRALYADPDNPPAWYPAVIDRVIEYDDDTRKPLQYPKYIVTFPEYGNTETVTLGEIDLLDSNDDENNGTKTARHRHGGGKKQMVHEEMDLYEQVRARERERVAGKHAVIARPPTTKQSLAAPNHRYYRDDDDDDHGVDKKDRYQRRGHNYSNVESDAQKHHRSAEGRKATMEERHGAQPQLSQPSSKKRTPEEAAAIAEKKRRLLAKYG